jgi:L-glutamine-phosphate cytidylyltransferase
MKAILLSAGRGTRLMPLTASLPKCLVEVGGRSVLSWQLSALAEAGFDEAVVVSGFGALHVEREVRRTRHPGLRVRTLFNPQWETTDNLVSCLAARREMQQDFLLLNGDTLVEPGILRRLVASPRVLVSVAVVRKRAYDADDMKVRSGHGWLDHIGKGLPVQAVDGEAIGVSLYRGDGPRVFVEALEEARESGDSRWYLSAVELLAQRGLARTVLMNGLGYAEIDYPEDLARAESLVAGWRHHRDSARMRASVAA